MTGVLTYSFKTDIALLQYNNFVSSNNTNYLFIGRHTPYPSDSNPPIVDRSINGSNYEVYDNLIAGLKIAPADVSLMIRNIPWVSNTVYAKYDTFDINLKESDFYVATSDGGDTHVFLCISNNNDSPSTYAPVFESEVDEFYSTADGYVWKYIYSIPTLTYTKFSTENYIPLLVNANVQSATIPGEISFVEILDAGGKYNSYANGFFFNVNMNDDKTLFGLDVPISNTNFYTGSAIKIVDGDGIGEQKSIIDHYNANNVTIVQVETPFTTTPTTLSRYEITPNVIVEGDGQGCIARAIINTSSNTISSIEVNDYGNNYTWATASVVSNVNILGQVNQPNTSLLPIIPPYGGFTQNTVYNFFCDTVGVSTIVNNGITRARSGFRNVGVLHNPIFKNVTLEFANASSTFIEGESLTANSGMVANVVSADISTLDLNSLTGIVEIGDTIVGGTSNSTAIVTDIIKRGEASANVNYFDQTFKLEGTFDTGSEFAINTLVTCPQTNAYGYVAYSNVSSVVLTNVRGNFLPSNSSVSMKLTDTSTVFNINTIYEPDLIRGSGSFSYLENFSPIRIGSYSIIKLNITF